MKSPCWLGVFFERFVEAWYFTVVLQYQSLPIGEICITFFLFIHLSVCAFVWMSLRICEYIYILYISWKIEIGKQLSNYQKQEIFYFTEIATDDIFSVSRLFQLCCRERAHNSVSWELVHAKNYPAERVEIYPLGILPADTRQTWSEFLNTPSDFFSFPPPPTSQSFHFHKIKTRHFLHCKPMHYYYFFKRIQGYFFLFWNTETSNICKLNLLHGYR